MSDNLLPLGFEPCHRFDFFETSDQTALVCLDVPQMQRLVVDQLVELGFKIHTGMFLDDSILKLRTHVYDVVVVSEHFSGSQLGEHEILDEANRLPLAQRRKQLFVLIGASLTTHDEMQAFGCSVDVVVSLADVMNLKPVIRRGRSRMASFYAPLQEATAALQSGEATARGSRSQPVP